MRIISEFHDYYDVGMSEGQDQSLIYQRRPIVEVSKYYQFDTMHNSWYRCSGDYLKVRPLTIGFCGKLYKLLELNTPYGDNCSKKGRSTRKWAYNLRDVDTYVRNNYPKQYSDYLDSSVQNKSWTKFQRQRDFDSYFNGYKSKGQTPIQTLNNSNKWILSWFEKYPIFVAEYRPDNTVESRITYNAQLKSFEFYRIFDPYQAYQEIAMWLSNIAVPIKPMPEIPDKIMLEVKGFDKFSFRKDPSSKKRKK